MRRIRAVIGTAVGSIASIFAHGASLADDSHYVIEPELINTLQGIRPYRQSFVQASDTRFLHGSNSMLATWEGSNLLLIRRGPPVRANWE